MGFLAFFASDAFKKLLPYIIGAVLVASYTVAVYWAGGRGPRADLEKEKAEHRADVAQIKADMAKQKGDSDALIAKLNGDHAANVKQIGEDWAAFVGAICPGGVDGGVCRSLRPVSRPAAEPVRIVSGVCEDAARDDRLSDALSLYRDEVQRAFAAEREFNRRVIDGERAEVAGLLEACQKQTGALINVQDWAGGERAIHGGDGRPILLH